jgi:hypothetical protein
LAVFDGVAGPLIWRASSPSTPPTGIPTFGAYRFSNNRIGFGNCSIYNSFQIYAQQVPEPTTIFGSAAVFRFSRKLRGRVKAFHSA